VVVLNEYRGLNLGKIIIEDLLRISKEENCYKVILDCSEKNIQFYEKCGFYKTEIQMRFPKKN
jgi:glucosamine-phosphate N-acetyltransferase